MSFWSIRKILSDPVRSTGQDPSGAFSDLAVADFLLDSWFISFRVRPGSISLFLEGAGEEFSDLSLCVSPSRGSGVAPYSEATQRGRIG
jgi:hypothetical protein